MSDDSEQATHREANNRSGLTPKQRLEATNPRLLDACIVTIHDMETLHECVAYENQHKQRIPILEMLARRAEELREEDESWTGRHSNASGVVRPSERGGGFE